MAQDNSEGQFIPADERDKLYPFIPVSIIPVAIVTFIIMATLFFDFRGNFITNPVIFYALPFLYLLVFLTVDTPLTLMRSIGLFLPTAKSKIVALLSLPVGYLVGWGLVKIASAPGSFFKIATYPWVVLSTTQASLPLLASLTTTTNFMLYLVVAIFEEGTAIYMGKNIANWLDFKRMNTIAASIVGLFLGRMVLVAHHWFSYGGVSSPALYISAFIFFAIFTILGIGAGMLAAGFFTGEQFSNLKVVPILLPPMVAAHFAFDFTMSQLTVITPRVFDIVMPLISLVS